MTLPLDFHPAVHREVDQSYRFYERAQKGLGRQFLRAVEQTFATSQANPEHFGFAENEIREGGMKRFPFAIYFRVMPDRIRILSVFHTSRDPSEWMSRG